MTTSLTTCTIIFTSSLKLFCCGPRHVPTSQSISRIFLGSENISPWKGPFKGHLIIFCRELREPGEKMRFAFLLVNSSFQTNPTDPNSMKTKPNPKPAFPHLPTLWEFIARLWEGPRSPCPPSEMWDAVQVSAREEQSCRRPTAVISPALQQISPQKRAPTTRSRKHWERTLKSLRIFAGRRGHRDKLRY